MPNSTTIQTTESAYSYSNLPEGCIRLLRLFPHQDEATPIRYDLIKYPLLKLAGSFRHLYDALSYVWGSSEKTQYISMGNHNLPIIVNLHAALLHLRDKYFEQIMWVDAIYINQENQQERGQQVQIMAIIYTIASRVLQEIATARHVIITCGSMEIDGNIFCLGINALKLSYGADPDLQSLIHTTTYLIRRTVFLPKGAISQAGRISLDMHPLAELIKMYHTREASDCRDKVYALLGMSSDTQSSSGLSPDYNISIYKNLE
ncbi:hypothetical protein V8C37DRAFT_411156 [Trichoderma ceciliae]